MKRIFLDWQKPVLHSAIEFLIAQFSDGDRWDLTDVLVVLPSSLAGRRLGELFAEKAAVANAVLLPPEIVTVGTMPEKLYQAKFPFASDSVQVLAWSESLRAASPETLRPLLLDTPDPDNLAAWDSLARLLAGLHRELATDLLLCGDVADRLKGTIEEQRWRVLAKLQRQYLDRLHESEHWDIQTARRVAVEHGEPTTDKQIVVLGAVDLNSAQRKFLDSVSNHVTVLIGAPEKWSDGFDSHGALKPEFWQTLRVQFPDEKIHVRGTVVQAADEVARQVAALDGKYSAQEITIGVPDSSMIPMITESMDRNGVVARNGPGTPVEQSMPAQLLTAVREYLTVGSYQSFGALIRNPAVSRYLTEKTELPDDFLESVDQYYNDTMLGSMNSVGWPDHPCKPLIESVVEEIDGWLKPLRLPTADVADWSQRIQKTLLTVFDSFIADLDVEEDAMLYAACSHLCDAISELGQIPTNLDVQVDIGMGIDWLLSQIAQDRSPPLADPDSIELLGWLELALDDAPVLILTGIHDGVVPESVNADAFLPNQLRTELGLMDNARRYARDCYVFHSILNTREHSSIVLNHLDLDGSPQVPSRILLALEPARLARRVQMLIEPIDNATLPPVGLAIPAQKDQTQIPIPIPRAIDAIHHLSVTDFKSYIHCPYRFYLDKIHHLKSVRDNNTELAANTFGSLIHDALTPLKDSPVATSTNEDEIANWLIQSLAANVKSQLGAYLLPAVRLQILQAEQRLREFAKHQSQRAGDGWLIQHAEIAIEKNDGVEIIVDDEPIKIYGRIDRIDYHPQRDEWAVWDYKTGDNVGDPKKAHVTGRKSERWHDLQLPLYRKLVRRLGITGKVSVGYIKLGKSAEKTGFHVADFSDDELHLAHLAAEDVIRNIRQSIYWPPSSKIKPEFDISSSICQTNVATPWRTQLDDGKRPIESGIENKIADCKSALGKKSAVMIGETHLRSILTGQSRQPQSKPSPQDHLNSATSGCKPTDKQIDSSPVHLQLEHRTPDETAPIDWFKFLSIKASAGTGKTYQLAMRLLRLLFSGESPDTVLATTFTRKAAGEILERVLQRLADAILNEDELAQLQRDLVPLKVDRDNCEYQLARLCSNLHRFRVSTLDSFYSQMARSCALELGLPPGWTIADPFKETMLQNEAIRRMFETQNMTRLKSILAMLFKGETDRSISSQIRDVIRSGFELYRITDLEQWQAIDIPSAVPAERVNAAYQFLENAALTTNAKGKLTREASAIQKIVDSFYRQDYGATLKSTLVVASQSNEPMYYKKTLPHDLVDALRVIAQHSAHIEFSGMKNQLLGQYEILEIYAQQLEFVQRASRAISFSDVAFVLSSWMLDNIDTPKTTQQNSEPPPKAEEFINRINWRLDSSIDHLLLDEFQDTSPPQWEIIKPFAEAIAREGVRRGRSFFCVGDTKQAIYAWRGGVAEIFDAVGDKIRDVEDDNLVQSWRSSNVVMQLVNEIFSNLSQHENYGDGIGAVSQWQQNFPKHTTAVERAGYVQLRNGPKVSSRGPDDDQDEMQESLMEIAADEIAQLAEHSSNVSIGVLFRGNAAVAEMINLLRDRGLNPSQEGGNPLTDSAAVELLLSLLTLADHPGDKSAGYHIQNSPLLIEMNVDPMQFANQIALQTRLEISQRGYGRTLAGLSRLLATYCTHRDQQRLKQLVQQAFKYDVSPSLRVIDFVDFIRQEKVNLPKPAQIRVMTIHQSKGLEFDAVFLPGLSKQLGSRSDANRLVPKYDSMLESPDAVIRYVSSELRQYMAPKWQQVLVEDAERKLVEDLCIFYVALTRARRALYLYSNPRGKSATKNWGSALHSILVSHELVTTENEIVYESGDAQWWQEITSDTKSTSDTSDLPPVHIDLATTDSRPFRRFRISRKPSAAGESRTVALSSSLQTSVSVGAIIGTLVHRWFEEVYWLEDFEFNSEHLRHISLQTLTHDEMKNIHLDDWIREMERMIGLNSVRAALSRDRYATWTANGIDRIEVANERRLLEIDNENDTLIRGTIDRLVLGWQGDQVVKAEIIDYKTDAIDDAVSIDAWTHNRALHHAPQLDNYRRLIAKQYDLSIENISLYLVLLSSDHLLDLQPALAQI